MEKTEDSRRGHETEGDEDREREDGRMEETLEKQDSCEDLEEGASMPSNFTLCLN